MTKTQEKWIAAYQKKDALWIHDNDPKRPHALLASGKHSSGFFNSRLVIPDTLMLRDAAIDLLELLTQNGGNIEGVDGVVGPQTGATKLAELLSNHIADTTNNGCFWASPAKSESEGRKSMVFTDQERELLRSKYVLPCEDVLTTGDSVELAIDAIGNAGGDVTPFILVLVNRSGLSVVHGKRIVALIDRAMPMWEPDECPLCKGGSEAIRPKDNWARLTAAS